MLEDREGSEGQGPGRRVVLKARDLQQLYCRREVVVNVREEVSLFS